MGMVGSGGVRRLADQGDRLVEIGQVLPSAADAPRLAITNLAYATDQVTPGTLSSGGDFVRNGHRRRRGARTPREQSRRWKPDSLALGTGENGKFSPN